MKLKSTYFTSGQFWVGLLVALGLVLMCMPFSAPVVLPALGLAALVSTSAWIIALEAFTAFVGGFGLSQLLWKFGDRYQIAIKLQKFGRWLEKNIRKGIFIIASVVQGAIGLISLLLSLFFRGGLWLTTEFPWAGWILGIPLMVGGFGATLGGVIFSFVLTCGVALSAALVGVVGLVLEALGWFFGSLFLREISYINPASNFPSSTSRPWENREGATDDSTKKITKDFPRQQDTFIQSCARWVLYVIGFPFLQLQKLGHFLVDIGIILWKSAVTFGVKFTVLFILEETSSKDADEAWEAVDRAGVYGIAKFQKFPDAASYYCQRTPWVSRSFLPPEDGSMPEKPRTDSYPAFAFNDDRMILDFSAREIFHGIFSEEPTKDEEPTETDSHASSTTPS